MTDLPDNMADLLDRIGRHCAFGVALTTPEMVEGASRLREHGLIHITATAMQVGDNPYVQHAFLLQAGARWLQERARLRASTPTTVPEAERQLAFPEDP